MKVMSCRQNFWLQWLGSRVASGSGYGHQLAGWCSVTWQKAKRPKGRSMLKDNLKDNLKDTKDLKRRFWSFLYVKFNGALLGSVWHNFEAFFEVHGDYSIIQQQSCGCFHLRYTKRGLGCGRSRASYRKGMKGGLAISGNLQYVELCGTGIEPVRMSKWHRSWPVTRQIIPQKIRHAGARHTRWCKHAPGSRCHRMP